MGSCFSFPRISGVMKAKDCQMGYQEFCELWPSLVYFHISRYLLSTYCVPSPGHLIINR